MKNRYIAFIFLLLCAAFAANNAQAVTVVCKRGFRVTTNYFDQQARFFQNSALLQGYESGFFPVFQTRDFENRLSGKRKEEP